jgi:hypothetical protein
MLARDFYIKLKEREREQDSGETKREYVRERQSVAGRGKESKTAQSPRESVCERQSIAGRGR